MKALVNVFNQDKALVGAFSVIVTLQSSFEAVVGTRIMQKYLQCSIIIFVLLCRWSGGSWGAARCWAAAWPASASSSSCGSRTAESSRVGNLLHYPTVLNLVCSSDNLKNQKKTINFMENCIQLPWKAFILYHHLSCILVHLSINGSRHLGSVGLLMHFDLYLLFRNV